MRLTPTASATVCKVTRPTPSPPSGPMATLARGTAGTAGGSSAGATGASAVTPRRCGSVKCCHERVGHDTEPPGLVIVVGLRLVQSGESALARGDQSQDGKELRVHGTPPLFCRMPSI